MCQQNLSVSNLSLGTKLNHHRTHQTTWQSSFLKWWFKEWNLDDQPLPDGTLLDSFLQEQSVIELRLRTNYEVMAGKRFFPCKYNRQTLGKVISISQISIPQRNVDTIGKLELTGKITLYVIFYG